MLAVVHICIEYPQAAALLPLRFLASSHPSATHPALPRTTSPPTRLRALRHALAVQQPRPLVQPAPQLLHVGLALRTQRSQPLARAVQDAPVIHLHSTPAGPRWARVRGGVSPIGFGPWFSAQFPSTLTNR